MSPSKRTTRTQPRNSNRLPPRSIFGACFHGLFSGASSRSSGCFALSSSATWAELAKNIVRFQKLTGEGEDLQNLQFSHLSKNELNQDTESGVFSNVAHASV